MVVTLNFPQASSVSVTICNPSPAGGATTVNINNSCEVCHRCRRPPRHVSSRNFGHGFHTPSPSSSELFSDGSVPSPPPYARVPATTLFHGASDLLSPLSSRLGAIHGLATQVASRPTDLASMPPPVAQSSGAYATHGTTIGEPNVQIRPQGPRRRRPLPPTPSSSCRFKVQEAHRPLRSSVMDAPSLPSNYSSPSSLYQGFLTSPIEETSIEDVTPPSRSSVQSPPPHRPPQPISFTPVSSTSCISHSSSMYHQH